MQSTPLGVLFALVGEDAVRSIAEEILRPRKIYFGSSAGAMTVVTNPSSRNYASAVLFALVGRT